MPLARMARPDQKKFVIWLRSAFTTTDDGEKLSSSS
jgi:hypothetical protein